jgi:hypothetical protein
MNFAYIDAASIFEQLLQPQQPSLMTIPWEPDAEWKSFEKELGNFKTKYNATRCETQVKMAELNQKTEEISVLKMMLDHVKSNDLKESLESMIYKHETEEGIPALSQQCGEGLGKLEAMKKILKDTEAERYAKFTCFVCQDRLIDLFIDPCGHVVCDMCWVRTRDKTTCPGCRSQILSGKRIFTL